MRYGKCQNPSCTVSCITCNDGQPSGDTCMLVIPAWQDRGRNKLCQNGATTHGKSKIMRQS
jgi:hypothetical protein